MTVSFGPYELPVAYSMIQAARQVRSRRDGYHPFQKYLYYWIAFNNIYTTIAFTGNRAAQLVTLPNGTIETRPNGSVDIPRVKTVREKDQIALALKEFDNSLKDDLITHPSTEFFVNRTPSWHGTPIYTNHLGQRLNGVLNVNYTTSLDYTVWSPLDVPAYNQYIENGDVQSGDLLAEQIVDILYTIRNNLVHGGKRFDDGNDIIVVENALPLLTLIVSAFTR